MTLVDSGIPGLRLWEKQDFETDREYNVFRFWLEQDHPRDLDVAAQREVGSETNSRGALIRAASWVKKAYAGYYMLHTGDNPLSTWTERARAYDLHTQKRDLLDRQLKRNLVRAAEFDTAMKLMHKAREMLEWPIYNEEVEEGQDGTATIVRTPAKWAVRDVSGMVKTASELARLATDMEQGHYTFTLNLTLSPDAVEALNYLENFGIDTADIMREYETVIIETAQRYARTSLGIPDTTDGDAAQHVSPTNGGNGAKQH